jgi:hypothetical protein
VRKQGYPVLELEVRFFRTAGLTICPLQGYGLKVVSLNTKEGATMHVPFQDDPLADCWVQNLSWLWLA